MPLIDTTEAAKRLKVSRRRVLALITDKRLPAKRFGERQWQIDSNDLELVRMRKPGRPNA